jgi:hypothetical protein
MKRLTQLVAATWCVLLFAGAAFAQTGDRLTDKEVKALLDTVDKGRDRFEDQLDGRLKDSILRLPNGEVNVARFLDDLQENTGRLKERFTSEYAASAEVATVLRQSTAIDAFMKQKPGIKGGSEWDSLAATLGRLAAVYGTKFPLPADGPVRRIGDAEAAEAAAAIEEQAGQFKSAVNREPALAKPAKDGLKDQADLVKNAAKTLKSRLNGSKPATSEARQLFAAMSRMRESASGLTPAFLGLISQMQAPLTTLNQAFGVATPRPGT